MSTDRGPSQGKPFTHVDVFIDRHLGADCYARFVLDFFRKPAALRSDFAPFMKSHRLFCTYKGIRYRVTGASTLGWLRLSPDVNEEWRYELTATVDDVTDFGAAP